MCPYLSAIRLDVLSLFMFLSSITVGITIASTSSDTVKQADEYIMTSAIVDGIKRSNVCGDGYRIEGAVLKSYPYSAHETYPPYEDCTMTFQARRSDHRIRIRILIMDLNDIHSGTNCLDSLRFYHSTYVKRNTKLNSVECGQVTEIQKFNLVSSTGIVTAHFNTDGGNVNGLGFKVVLTAFRSVNKTHPCDPDDDEFLCHQGDCISRSLLCDGVPHCLDNSDELPNRLCLSNAADSLYYERLESNHRVQLRKHQHWRGILIVAFLLIIFIAFTLFTAYLICRRCIQPSTPLSSSDEKKSYPSMVRTSGNGATTTTSTQILREKNLNRQRVDKDHTRL